MDPNGEKRKVRCTVKSACQAHRSFVFLPSPNGTQPVCKFNFYWKKNGGPYILFPGECKEEGGHSISLGRYLCLYYLVLLLASLFFSALDANSLPSFLSPLSPIFPFFRHLPISTSPRPDITSPLPCPPRAGSIPTREL